MRDDNRFVLGKPPEEYDPRYMGQVVKQIQDALNFIIGVGPVRANTINIANLPPFSADLRPGDLYNDGSNNVKVVP